MTIGRTANLAAAQAAARALNDAGFDQSRPIDPFEAIDRIGLELAFRPLGDLLGAILPGPNPGVLINSSRPASVQRFTAAHEIGHWYMDQDALAIDTQDEVEGMPAEQRERNAQVFASHFLMPLELLYATASEHGVSKGGSVTARQAYGMARNMHVSYRAVVFQLVNTKFIGARTRDELLSFQPAQMKRELTNGRKRANSRGDVWAINGDRGDIDVEVFVGDEIVVALPENPSTGYRWVESSNSSRPESVTVSKPPEPFGGEYDSVRWQNARSNVIPLRVSDIVDPVLIRVMERPDTVAQARLGESPVLIGGVEVRRFEFEATRAGQSSLSLDYVRPFSATDASESMVVHAHVRALPEVENRHRQLFSFAKEEHAAESTQNQ